MEETAVQQPTKTRHWFYDFTATKTSLKVQYQIYNKDEAKVTSAKSTMVRVAIQPPVKLQQ